MDESLLKAFFSLSACVVSLLVVYYVVKKYAAKKGKLVGEGDSSFTVISRQPLPPKGMLYLISVGGRRLLIGATEQQVSLLADITAIDKPVESPSSMSRTVQTSGVELSSMSVGKKIPRNPLEERIDTEADSVSFSAFLKTVLSREQPARK